MNGFEDKFAYAVSIAQLRDGLKGSVEFLRATERTNELVSVLTHVSRRLLLDSFTGGTVQIDKYNEAWAEIYLAQVAAGERRGSD